MLVIIPLFALLIISNAQTTPNECDLLANYAGGLQAYSYGSIACFMSCTDVLTQPITNDSDVYNSCVQEQYPDFTIDIQDCQEWYQTELNCFIQSMSLEGKDFINCIDECNTSFSKLLNFTIFMMIILTINN